MMDDETTDAVTDTTVITDETTDASTDASTALTSAEEGSESSDSTDSGDADSTDDQNTDSGDADGEGQTFDEYFDSLTIPEGVEVDDDAKTLFGELSLTKEQTQKIIDYQAAKIEADNQAQVETFNKTKDQWLNDAKADKEIGGDKFNESLSVAKNALKTFGSDDFVQLLNQSGLGNHPELIRFMAKVGATLREDKLNSGNPPSSKPANKEQERVNTLYPD